MELSKNILEGIALAGNASDISEAKFRLLLSEIFKQAVSNKNLTETKCGADDINNKTAYSCLFSLLLEASKHNVDVSTLSSVLDECRWDSGRASSFTRLYAEHKERIQAPLSMIGNSSNQIVDVKWRQDFVIKNSNCEKICEPSYLLSLKTWNPHSNETKDVTFSCNVDHLQDLVLKLKDATKCIERNAM
ncbi:hypothetical protein JTE90_017193 [Oedothorax gibbosus]|uniref:COMM domain-containing protein 3 n=1 Tax=Oedothorax gibbosus TaxID=931172 RepID=A0AAV6V7G6_9ARAC|nr:hypothetical protein JTE90_017193 [Oedothorax gibbosus]